MDHEKYLGADINNAANIDAEINKRIADSMAVANRLKSFLLKANATTKWKIRAYDAIVVSKLLYGLETTNLTACQAKKLDTFQLKCLRRIMNLTTTFINRENTNEKVYKLAEALSGKPIMKLSTKYNIRRSKLLGHIIRADEEDPLKIVSLENDRPWLPEKRRIGLPRQDWFEETYNFTWKHILKRPEPTVKWAKDSNSAAIHIIQEVNRSARDRVF